MTNSDDTATQLAELKAEVERLRAAAAQQGTALLTIGGAQESSLPPSNFTIHGLEELVLLVDARGCIAYCNSGMAALLGNPDKHALLRLPLADYDTGPLGAGFFTALAQSAAKSERTVVVERSVAATLLAMLDEPSAVPVAERVLRFVAHPVEGRVQVVVQDVTQLRWLERSFSRYVSPEVITQLMAVPAEDLQRVERRVVSVVFTDLRAFTRVCEELPAAEVTQLLNSHFAQLIAAVREYGGTVDKLIGDSLMAVFGAPLNQADFTVRALAAALSMQERHTRWSQEQLKQGKPAPGLGIGMATGEVVVGNIGAIERMDYTAIGLTVSVAHRLCQAAAPGQVLTEPQTYDAAKGQIAAVAKLDVPWMSFESAGTMQLKNLTVPVKVLSVVPEASEAARFAAGDV